MQIKCEPNVLFKVKQLSKRHFWNDKNLQFNVRINIGYISSFGTWSQANELDKKHFFHIFALLSFSASNVCAKYLSPIECLVSWFDWLPLLRLYFQIHEYLRHVCRILIKVFSFHIFVKWIKKNFHSSNPDESRLCLV